MESGVPRNRGESLDTIASRPWTLFPLWFVMTNSLKTFSEGRN
jgi:hypothetical protein